MPRAHAHAHAQVEGQLVEYADLTAPLEPSDLDDLEPPWPPPCPPTSSNPQPGTISGNLQPGTALPGPNLSAPTGGPLHWAWKVSFSLPASVYATMFLRELLHDDLDVQEHMRKSRALLVGSSQRVG